jgi:RNA polymerase sigma factor (sigma-70 family)
MEGQTEGPDSGLAWLTLNMDAAKGICQRGARGRSELVDELWDNVVLERVQRCFETWDVAYGVTLSWHMKNNLRLYCFKWMVKNATRVAKQEPLYDVHLAPQTCDHEVSEMVYKAMAPLSEYERQLFVLHHVFDMPFSALGEMLGISKSAARVHYLRAKAKLLQRPDETGIA